jgi:hypothetical protein
MIVVAKPSEKREVIFTLPLKQLFTLQYILYLSFPRRGKIRKVVITRPLNPPQGDFYGMAFSPGEPEGRESRGE